MTAFCQHLLRLIKSGFLADTDISAKSKYLADLWARPIYQSISIPSEKLGFLRSSVEGVLLTSIS